MKRKGLGVLALVMAACICGCGSLDTTESSKVQEEVRVEESSASSESVSESQEESIGITAAEAIAKFREKETPKAMKMTIASDITMMLQYNEDTTVIRSYEDKENMDVVIQGTDGSVNCVTEWIGNGEEDIVTTTQYNKDGMVYTHYEGYGAPEDWYVTEMVIEDDGEEDTSFLHTVEPENIALTEDGGYLLTGSTNPEKGRELLSMIQQYRLYVIDQFVVNYELKLDADFNLQSMKFYLEKPYKVMPNAVDQYDDLWTIKVLTVQSFELDCFDVGVENVIELPEGAENAIPAGN